MFRRHRQETIDKRAGMEKEGEYCYGWNNKS